MAFLDVIVKHSGVDISNSVVSYNREHIICTGIGSLELTVPLSISRTFLPWDTIEIWENGNKVTPFYISFIKKDGAKGTITIQAQDTSKRLTDYFVTDTYLIDYLSYSKYWIEKFLGEVGINYGYLGDSTGVPLSNNTSLGFDSAYNIILTLLQQSGWYMYFDEDGKAWIGELNKDMHDPDHTITNAVVMSVEREQDDERLRNRAVVWGNTNPVYGEVFVDISVHTPYNYDLDDKRAVVYANSSIFSNEQALELAQLLLKEFTKIKDEKVVVLPNDYAINVGDTVFLDVRGWNGTGLITTLVSSLSDKGLVYTLTIDEHCPRLFTFFSTMPPTVSGFPVFIGTWGDGIWTRQVDDTTWYNSSAGLENLYIKDLFIKDGIFSTVAGDGYLYTKTLEGSWIKYLHPDLRAVDGVVTAASEIQAEICSINPSNNIVVGYNTVASGEGTQAWILELDSGRNLINADQVVIGGGTAARVIDLEAGDNYNIISAYNAIIPSGQTTIDTLGYRTINLFNGHSSRVPFPPDSNSRAFGPSLGYTFSDQFTTGATGGSLIISSIVIEDNTQLIWYLTVDGLVMINPEAGTTIKYPFITPSEWPTVNPQRIQGVIRRKFSDTFTIAVVYGENQNIIIRHYEYSLSTNLLLEITNHTVGPTLGVAATDAIVGGGLIEQHFVIQWYQKDSQIGATIFDNYVTVYNLTSQNLNTTYFHSSTILLAFPSRKTLCTGDEIICTAANLVVDWPGSDVACNPLHPIKKPKSVSAEMSYYRVGRFGPIGASAVGLGLIITPGDEEWLEGTASILYADAGGRSAANTLLGEVYLRFGWGTVYHNCLGTILPMGYTTYVRLPSGTVVSHVMTTNPQDSTGQMGILYGNPPLPNWSTFVTVYVRNGVPCFLTQATSTGTYNLNSAVDGSVLASDIDLNTIGVTGGTIAKDDLDGTIMTSHNTSPEGKGMTTGWAKVKDFDTSTKFSATQFYPTQKYVLEVASSTSYNAVRVWYYDEPALVLEPYGIYKHTHTNSIVGSTASDLASEQTQGIFELLYNATVPLKVEISKGAPTVIYSIPAIGSSSNSILAASILNEPASFYAHTEDKQVWEAKVFDLANPSQFPTTSGVFTETNFERYIGIVNTEGLLASNYGLVDPWVKMATSSGLVNHLETTNYHPSGTYFFYSYSGAANFFQKNPTESVWRDYSSGLPASEITIIRCDDLI